MNSTDELVGYMWLKPYVTGLIVDIFVDDGAAYARDSHEPLVYVRNGYGRGISEFIPFAIKDNQQILDATIEIKLTVDVISAVQSFIKLNEKILMELADSIIRHEKFYKQVKPIWTDEQSGIYSNDKKRLLRAPDVKRYRIAEGCEVVDDHAFEGCKILEVLYMPYTMSEEEVDKTLNIMPESVDNVCAWDRPYVEEVYDVNEYWHDENDLKMDIFGVIYANEGRRILTATKPELIGKEYVVPDGVLTICDGAFAFCRDYLVLSVPWSIEVIGDYIFGKEGGLIKIRKKGNRQD